MIRLAFFIGGIILIPALSIGLIQKSRLHVHLSKDIKTAVQVGSWHGKPMVYKELAGKMAQDGYKFYLSVNGVWLTDKVPVEYLSLIEGTEI